MTLNALDIHADVLFISRPRPIAADMRIGWRVALLTIILFHSRGKKASVSKLHLLNDALRDQASMEKLTEILENRKSPLSWRPRIEPALNRALRFLVSSGSAEWDRSGDRATLQLTQIGERAATSIKSTELLNLQSAFLTEYGKKITEVLTRQLMEVTLT